ncbi:MAG TPA: undecaprenyl-diphosphate phosphatase [Polyangiaceae bacterium]|nr:undecaprenyl-diphosphate phosphatase [Polyangiaceae bacterium]
MQLTIVEALSLGALQGLTEFLPVSSDGHLALAQLLFDVEDGGLPLNVLLHAGTLLATVIVLRARVRQSLLAGGRGVIRPRQLLGSVAGRDALVVALATLPTAVIGLLLRDPVERWTSSPLAVGLGFLLTTIALASTRWAERGDDEGPTASVALLLGVVQGLAVLPGVSRSGLTIAVALWAGVRPARAFELSMLISLPAIAGAVLLEVPALLGAGFDPGRGLVGAATAFAVGLLALWLLRGTVVRGHFPLFALWTLPLAVATLAMARVWPGGG